MRCPSLLGRYLADQWRRLDPKAIVLNESYDARINFPSIEQPENYLLISQVGFVNHSGAPASLLGPGSRHCYGIITPTTPRAKPAEAGSLGLRKKLGSTTAFLVGQIFSL
jgi:hypothetical protein